jgi:hypothetical protein
MINGKFHPQNNHRDVRISRLRAISSKCLAKTGIYQACKGAGAYETEAVSSTFDGGMMSEILTPLR